MASAGRDRSRVAAASGELGAFDEQLHLMLCCGFESATRQLGRLLIPAKSL